MDEGESRSSPFHTAGRRDSRPLAEPFKAHVQSADMRFFERIVQGGRSLSNHLETRRRSPRAIGLGLALLLLCLPRLALADGLGPGGYAMFGWIILMIFVAALLFVIGMVALLLSLHRERRKASRYPFGG